MDKVRSRMLASRVAGTLFSLVQSALEAKVGMAYTGVLSAAATALGQDSDSENEDEQEQKTGRIQRYASRCLLFVGDPDAKQRLLLWLAVGEPIMVIHYRFSIGTHGIRTRRTNALCWNFAPGLRNIAIPSLRR